MRGKAARAHVSPAVRNLNLKGERGFRSILFLNKDNPDNFEFNVESKVMNKEIKCECGTTLSYTISNIGGITIKTSKDSHVLNTEKNGKYKIICNNCEKELEIEI